MRQGGAGSQPAWPKTGRRTPAGATARTLKSFPIWSGPASRSTAAWRASRASGPAAAPSPAGAFEEPHGQQKVALRPDVGGKAGLPGDLRQGVEVDMGGEIGFARIGERVFRSVAAQRLQGVADGRPLIAVVDDEGRSAMFGQPRRDARHQLGFYCDAGLAPFEARPELWEDLRRTAKSGAWLVIHETAVPRHFARLLDEGRPADARLTQAIVAGWQLVSVRFAVAETYRSLASGRS